MKKIFYLAMILPVILLSCTDKVPEARFGANFSTDTFEPEVGQTVYFTNDSKHADRYEWDFGDGVTSVQENPSHIFTGTGLFIVELKAFNGSMDDIATMDLEIFIPTLLEIDVFEWNEDLNYDNPIADASVYLYPNLTSWDGETNIFAEGFTDLDGVVVFSHLNEQRYYVDVSHQDYNNYALAAEDVGWIETGIVLPHKINWFIAWVDYIDVKGEMGERRGGSYVIKKLERKIVNADKPAVSEGWETLYEKSVKVK